MQSLLPQFLYLDVSRDLETALPTTYNWMLVTLSVMIASLAAYAALGGAGRISAAKTSVAKWSWLATGAVAMGIGVWAMHFVGMLAFTLPVSVGYDVLITVVSMVPAILASGIVLHLISQERIGVWRLILGGVLMGSGIGVMHYTGMAAMRMDAVMAYDPLLFFVSILVAVALSITALYTKFLVAGNTQSLVHWTQWGTSLVMGCAVSGMHYTGMAAAYFFPGSGSYVAAETLNPVWLGAWVSLASVLIIGVAILVIVIDRRLEAARKYSENLERVVAERTSQLASANVEITALNEQLQTENLRMGAELDVTRRLQQMILPTAEELQQIDGLDIACHMQAADEVGGDYYDVLQHNGQVKIGIGDVTGHGLESGVVMVMTQAIVRALLTNGETDPVRFLTAINHVVYANMQRIGSDKNLTLCLLDYADGVVNVSGQHEELIVVRHDGTVEMVDTNDLGFPIGLDAEIADFIGQTTVRLQPGDGIVLYTDGITEADNMADEQYGLERLRKVVRKHWEHSAEAIKDAVVSDVKRYIGEQTRYDDITLVVAKQI